MQEPEIILAEYLKISEELKRVPRRQFFCSYLSTTYQGEHLVEPICFVCLNIWGYCRTGNFCYFRPETIRMQEIFNILVFSDYKITLFLEICEIHKHFLHAKICYSTVCCGLLWIYLSELLIFICCIFIAKSLVLLNFVELTLPKIWCILTTKFPRINLCL